MEQTRLSQIVRPVTKYLEYVTSSKKHVKCMIERMEELEGRSNDIKMKIDINRIESKEVPARAIGWLFEVEEIKEDVRRISNIAIGALNMKLMYQAGRRASEATKMIQKLITEQELIIWTDVSVPLERIIMRMPKLISEQESITWTDDKVPLERIRSSGVDVFMSRQRPFEDALKLLQRDDYKSQVIALCGMGGVGKTTMMEQLIQVANDKKMFNFILKVVIGINPNILSIQNDIATMLEGKVLCEATIEGRAHRIHIKIKKMLEGDKKRILVILDDVWEKLDLKVIGLESPLPKGIKVMLTSRSEVPCQQIATSVGSVAQFVPVSVLDEREAQIIFFERIGASREYNSDLYHIGCDIVKKCGGLPVAIIIVASALRYEEHRHIWEDALSHLNKDDNDVHHIILQIIEMTLDNLLEDEDKEIFLHCGLFPKDYDISIEYLARYAWGLKIFKNVYTLREARKRTKKCVHNLIAANLLMSSNHLGCVKMHDLAHGFVLNRISRGDLVWTIKHGDVSDWGSDETSESCTRISLTCSGPSKLPTEFKYPNLSLLQLMHGDMREFPDYFYENMEKLEVIAYYKMHHPLLPRCSTSLTTLSLHECTLESDDDYSFVGDLVNLEILSFAHCGIRMLPSTIGKLKRLKLLDLTGCDDLQIDDGVFLNLHNLEELYMRVSDGKAIRFTDSNWEEFKIPVNHLYALEAEFVDKKTSPENLSFNRLEKFKISIGCLLDEYDRSSFTNTLKIVTKSGNDILDSQINKLFMATDKLYLQVQDMIGLERIVSFSNLRELTVFSCAELKYVFPIHVASGLRKLRRLKVSSCSVLETLVCNEGSDINSGGGEMLKFEVLKFLSLENLPKLVSLFHVDIVVELPQLVELEVDGLPNFSSISALLNTQVKIGMLEILKIGHMEKLKQILTSSSEEEGNNVSMLREIEVLGCNSLVHLFPTNPMKLLIHLERLEISKCGSVGEIFNIDLEYAGHEIEQVSPDLRRIRVEGCDSLVNFFPTSLLGLLNQLEEVEVENCGSIKEIFYIDLRRGGEVKEVSSSLRSIRVYGCDALVNLFPTNPMGLLNHLEEVKVKNCGSIREIFSIDLGRGGDFAQVSSLRSILVEGCDNLVNLFSTNPVRLVNHLEELKAKKDGSVKLIFDIDLDLVSQIEQLSRSRRSSFRGIEVFNLEKERVAWRLNGGESNSSLLIPGFEYLKRIKVEGCKGFKSVFVPTDTRFQMKALTDFAIKDCGENGRIMELVEDSHDKEIKILSSKERDDNVSSAASPSNFSYHRDFDTGYRDGLEMVIEIENQSNRNNEQPLLPNVLGHLNFSVMERMSHVWKCSNWDDFLYLQKQHQQSSFHNLTTIRIRNHKNIKYLISSQMAKLLSNLKTIQISLCDEMEEVVLKEDEKRENVASAYTHTTTSFFPCLHLLSFENMINLKRIDGGGAPDQLQSVDSWSLCEYSTDIHIRQCNALSSVIPSYAVGRMQKLEVLTLNRCESLMEVFDTTALAIRMPKDINVPQLTNLKKLVITFCGLLQHVFTFSTLKSLWKLEELTVSDCEGMKVIVKNENGEQENGEVQVFPCLKFLKFFNLPNLEGFFLGESGFQWPLLENVMISKCPQMKMFTFGQSTAPELKYIHTSLGKHSLECGLNFHVTTDSHQTSQPPSLEQTSLLSTTLKQLPWSFCNLIELNMTHCWKVKSMISSNNLLQLHKLENIRVHDLFYVEEVFEVVAMEDANSAFEDSESDFKIKTLKQVELKDLFSLKYIWKINPRITLLFPNLTTVSVDNCNSLQHIFTSSMIGSLLQLRVLHISDCPNMKVIVKAEEYEDDSEEEELELDARVKEIIVLPSLKSLTLVELKSLTGFCLGEDSFSLPALHTLEIKGCPELTGFTNGNLDAPTLQHVIIHTD